MISGTPGAKATGPSWMGFWHGFGPCGPDSSLQILRRKQAEIGAAGWTLWLARRAPGEAFAAWHRQLLAASPTAVHVLCAATRPPEPEREPSIAWRSYRLAGEGERRPIPEPITLLVPAAWPHSEGLAFVVQEVLHPAPPPPPARVQWFAARKSAWKRTPVPEASDNLLREGPGAAIRAHSALLLLRRPYLAIVSAAG